MTQLVYPTAPGVTVNLSASTGGSGPAAPNAIACIVGIADRGPVVPTQVLDLLDAQRIYGTRNAAAATLLDSIELAFAEGNSTVIVNRVVGATPTYGFLQLVDRTGGTPVPTMRVQSAFYGSQSANLSIGVTAGTVANSFDVSVYDTASATPTVPVATFRDNTSVANAVAAINASNNIYITATDLASSSTGTQAFPALSTGVGAALSAGTDDRTTASDTTWAAAAGAFPRELGGGVLLAPGRYTSSFHLLLMAAALAQGRVALLDGPPTPAAADLTSLALSDSSGPGYIDPGDVGLGFSPWLTMPPAPGGSVPRTVPMSAGVAGLIARGDIEAGHSNQAPIGVFGNFEYATGLSIPQFNQSDRTTINGRQGTTGWNVARMTPDGPQLYGFRTVSAVVRSYMAANVRETLTLDRDINLIGDSFVGRTIDGQGLVFQDLYNELATRLRRDYDLGALFGATSSDAYNVDVGSTVNTRDSIRAGVIAARVWYIPSPTAEKVVINLIRNPVPTS